ncbi:MAG TPA: DUF4038 domain-containing protein [Tepidisphaeraceae bacterium]
MKRPSSPHPRCRQTLEPLEPRTLLAGNGLAAVYFDNVNLTGASISRTDPSINFNWKTGSPDNRIGSDTFSARWTGQVQARFTQEYTFSTVSDDGVRLWVNGKLIVDRWNDHALRVDRGTLFLTQGHLYDIKLEYYENAGGAVAALWWNSHTQRGQIIPQAYLYSSNASTPVPEPPVHSGGLGVSANGRYLVRADGSPFLYLADTAWQMPVKLNRADVDYYLRTRAAQGFNVVQVVAIDETYGRRNPYGQAPLVNNDANRPNDAYFDHIDYIIDDAAKYGITVALMPTWGRNVADPANRLFNATSAYNYGKFLGARYHKAGNLLGVNGGDWPVNDGTTAGIWRALAKGLSDGDGGKHLITFHPRGGQASRQYWGNESWLDFDMLQSGHERDSSAWNLVAGEYNRSPAKPIIEGEPNYEDLPVNAVHGSLSGPLLDAYDVRKKAYWEIFAGAAGTAYGANEVYPFATGSKNWKDALNLPGANQLKFLRALVESRPYFSRVPDQSVVVSNAYSGTDHIQATRDAGGAFAMVYSGSGKSFTVNMSKITAGRVTAAWYNPRTGKSTAIGRFDDVGTRTFVPPTQGYGQDWVLTLDRA